MHTRWVMKVSEVMTKFPATCTPDQTVAAAARLMISADCGAIPVVGEQDELPIGVITDRDIVVRAIANDLGPETLVRDCMTTPAITVTTETSLGDCIKLLEQRQIRRVFVVDEAGRCIGVVAQADIAEHASKRKAGELLQEVSRPSIVSTAATVRPT